MSAIRLSCTRLLVAVLFRLSYHLLQVDAVHPLAFALAAPKQSFPCAGQANCDPETCVADAYAGQNPTVYFGFFSCQDASQSPAFFCENDPTTYEKCCICPSPSATPSPSVTPSITPSNSITPSASRTPSVTPSISTSSEPEAIFPAPVRLAEIRSQPTNWDISGTVTDGLSGGFGASIGAAVDLLGGSNFAAAGLTQRDSGFIVGATSHVASWPDSAASGDVMAAYITDAGTLSAGDLWLTDMSEMVTANGLSMDMVGVPQFGASSVVLPDLDGNGMRDVAFGKSSSDVPAQNVGSFALLLLKFETTVVSSSTRAKITVIGRKEFTLPVTGEFNVPSYFRTLVDKPAEQSGVWNLMGRSMDAYDLDNDGFPELLVGVPGSKSAFQNDEGVSGTWDYAGAFRVVSLKAVAGGSLASEAGEVRWNHIVPASALAAHGITLPTDASFGYGVSVFTDLDHDGRPELVVSAPGVNNRRGAVYLISFYANSAGTTIDWAQTITLANVEASPQNGAFFGSAVQKLGDLNSDGVEELAIGSSFKEFRLDEVARGKVYVLSLNASREETCEYYLQRGVDLANTHGVNCSNQATSPMNLKTLVPSHPVPTFGIKYSYSFGGTDPALGLAVGDGFGHTLGYIPKEEPDLDMLLVGAPFRDDRKGAVFTFDMPTASKSSTPSPSPSPSMFPSRNCDENLCELCHYSCGGQCWNDELRVCGWEDCLDCSSDSTFYYKNIFCRTGACVPNGESRYWTPCQSCRHDSPDNVAPEFSYEVTASYINITVTSFGARLLYLDSEARHDYGASCPPALYESVNTTLCSRTVWAVWYWDQLSEACAGYSRVEDAWAGLLTHSLHVHVVDSEEETLFGQVVSCVDVHHSFRLSVQVRTEVSANTTASIGSSFGLSTALIDDVTYNPDTNAFRLSLGLELNYPFRLANGTTALECLTCNPSMNLTASLSSQSASCLDATESVCSNVFVVEAFGSACSDSPIPKGDFEFVFSVECQQGITCSPTILSQEYTLTLTIPEDLLLCQVIYSTAVLSLDPYTLASGFTTNQFLHEQAITLVMPVSVDFTPATSGVLLSLTLCEKPLGQSAASACPNDGSTHGLAYTGGVHVPFGQFAFVTDPSYPNRLLLESSGDTLQVTFTLGSLAALNGDNPNANIVLRMEIVVGELEGAGFTKPLKRKKSLEDEGLDRPTARSPRSRVGAVHTITIGNRGADNTRWADPRAARGPASGDRGDAASEGDGNDWQAWLADSVWACMLGIGVGIGLVSAVNFKQFLLRRVRSSKTG